MIPTSENQAEIEINPSARLDFTYLKAIVLSVSLKMIANVEEDPEQDLNALITEYYVEIDKKNQV